MDAYTSLHLVEKLSRKITCMIMEELTNSYSTDIEYNYFEEDFERIRNMTFMRMLRPDAGAKVSSPADIPISTPQHGISLN